MGDVRGRQSPAAACGRRSALDGTIDVDVVSAIPRVGGARPASGDSRMDRSLWDRSRIVRHAVLHLALAVLAIAAQPLSRPAAVRTRLTDIDLSGGRMPL